MGSPKRKSQPENNAFSRDINQLPWSDPVLRSPFSVLPSYAASHLTHHRVRPTGRPSCLSLPIRRMKDLLPALAGGDASRQIRRIRAPARGSFLEDHGLTQRVSMEPGRSRVTLGSFPRATNQRVAGVRPGSPPLTGQNSCRQPAKVVDVGYRPIMRLRWSDGFSHRLAWSDPDLPSNIGSL
jgi:hypothetical protein